MEINAVLKSPEVVTKIEQITQGILKKNQPVAEQVFSLRAQKSKISRQEKEFIMLASAATRQIKADSGNDAACAAVVRIKDDSSILDWEAKRR